MGEVFGEIPEEEQFYREVGVFGKVHGFPEEGRDYDDGFYGWGMSPFCLFFHMGVVEQAGIFHGAFGALLVVIGADGSF